MAVLAVPSRSNLELRFAAAVRHSRWVRRLRRAIPLVVVLLLAGTLALSLFNPFRALTGLPANLGTLAVSGTKITMKAPRLAGFLPDQRAYDVSARAAAQDLTKPTLVELIDPRAKIEMEDKTVVELDARKGVFDTTTEVLRLEDQIWLRASSGYESRLEEAVIDIRKGTVVSNRKVAVKLLNGTLDGNNLAISESGSTVRFSGGVSMTLMLNQDKPAADADAQAETTP